MTSSNHMTIPHKFHHLTADVTRGSILETIHSGHAVEFTLDQGVIRQYGDPDFVTTMRSSAKPLQALPLVLLDGAEILNLSDEELAICCASHPGTPRHSALAASVLALSGFLPDDLICGPVGENGSPLRHGCSGNHSALLLGAKLLNADLVGYELPDHPIEKYVADLIQEFSAANDMQIATDGCGVPTFGMTLAEMARSFAKITESDQKWSRIPYVMGRYPELIGGENWPDVRVMQVTQGRIIGKTGAEGLICFGMSGQGKGIAIKTIDGNPRALGPFSIQVLLNAGWITETEASDERLAGVVVPKLKDSRGVIVANITAKGIQEII